MFNEHEAMSISSSQEACCPVEARDGHNITPPSKKAMSSLLGSLVIEELAEYASWRSMLRGGAY